MIIDDYVNMTVANRKVRKTEECQFSKKFASKVFLKYIKNDKKRFEVEIQVIILE